MRQQMIRQYELALNPLVIATTRTAQDLLLRNIGAGAAISIQIEPLPVQTSPSAMHGIQLNIEFIASFHPLDYLETREEKLVSYTCYIETPGGDKEFLRNNLKLIPHLSEGNYCMTIHYEDIDGNLHKSLVQMGEKGTKLLSHT